MLRHAFQTALLHAPAEAQLPDAVALLDAACMLQVGQYVPGQHDWP